VRSGPDRERQAEPAERHVRPSLDLRTEGEQIALVEAVAGRCLDPHLDGRHIHEDDRRGVDVGFGEVERNADD
jgi:hypothetical protein